MPLLRLALAGQGCALRLALSLIRVKRGDERDQPLDVALEYGTSAAAAVLFAFAIGTTGGGVALSLDQPRDDGR